MLEEILCYIIKVNSAILDDNEPFRRDLRDSSPMPEEILCYMLKENSTLMDDNNPFRKDLRDSVIPHARRNSVLHVYSK